MEHRSIAQLDDLVAGVASRAGNRKGRFLLGVTGPPGAGKSTIADAVATSAEGVAAVVAPMDGFHRSNVQLGEMRILWHKGVPDSFDGAAFVERVRRLRREPPEPVEWPTFDRSREEVVPGGAPISRADRLVVIEGNYLLLDRPPWGELRSLLDEVWYLDVPERVLVERLMERQLLARAPVQAQLKMACTDLPNAALIAASRHRADIVVEYDGG